MFLVAGSGNRPLGVEISKILSCELVDFETRKFPDGERYLRFVDDIPHDTAVITQSFYKDPDDLMIEYNFLSRTLTDLGAKNIIGVFPYMSYLRQDIRFKPGEAISSRILASTIESTPTERLLTVDSHLHRISDLAELFTIPAINLSAIPSLADHLKSNYSLKDPIVVAPDIEAAQWSSKASPVLRADSVVMEKIRHSDTMVDIKLGCIDPTQRDIVLVDDIISTGGTMAQAAKVLKEQGVNHIYALITHGLFTEGAFERVKKAGVDALITSNSVPNNFSKVSVAPIIADALKQQ